MKASSVLALVFIAAVVIFVTGGGQLFSVFSGRGTELPRTIENPDRFLQEDAQSNTYAVEA